VQDTPEIPPEPADPAPDPEPGDFVRVRDCLPQVGVDLRYAGTDNFTGQTIYAFTDACLRYGTVEKLSRAQEALEEQGFSLLIWDAFRPVEAQFTLWEVCPHRRTWPILRPLLLSQQGQHRGWDPDGPGGERCRDASGFDDFSPLADRDYSDVSPAAAANAQLLEDVMEECGFRPYSGEWWHFTDTDDYPVEEDFSPG
jgi:D-alanyl-D-alanine dipeptidase